MITSTGNARVKWARALKTPDGRRETGLVLIEGVRLLEEALSVGAVCETLFVRTDFLTPSRHRAAVKRAEKDGAEIIIVSDAVLNVLKDTTTSPGLVGVFRIERRDCVGASSFKSGFMLLVDQCSDPGNLGTMFRMAEASGAQGIVLSKGSVSPSNPKVLRGAAGSVFRLPYTMVDDPIAFVGQIRKHGVQVVAAVPRGGHTPERINFRLPTLVLVGGEAAGLRRPLIDLATVLVSIPMVETVESLNIGIAASILLYEAARQHRRPGQLQTNKPR